MSGPVIAPTLFFNTEADEAAKFYTSIFPNSKIINTAYRDAEKTSPFYVVFSLNGQRYGALNGRDNRGASACEGDNPTPINNDFNESISLTVECKDQDEIDYYWDKLGEGGGGKSIMCGWLHDRFGVRWQIVPKEMGDLAAGPDMEAGKRVMGALMQMVKLDVAKLKAAYEGK